MLYVSGREKFGFSKGSSAMFTFVKLCCLVVLCFDVVCVPCAAAQPTVGSSAAFAHAQHLRHGINLSEWFAQVYDKRGYTREHFETWTTAEDITLIKSLGFD